MFHNLNANRKIWNKLSDFHFNSYHIQDLLNGKPLINELIQGEVGDVNGRKLIHLLCHIGTDTLSWKLLGADVTGLDLSPTAIRLARRLAGRMGLQAKFMVADALQPVEGLKGQFDIAFASTGVLCWLQDLGKFAANVRHLLKPGGFFYLHDGHPARYMLDITRQGDAVVRDDYFHKKVEEYEGFTDYAQKDLIVPGKFYEWNWTLGEVVTAFCDVGMEIQSLHEFPQYFYSGYDAWDVVNDRKELFPCTFSLKVVAPR